MPYEVKQMDGKYCVIQGDSTVKCHPTEAAAKAHMAALYANEGPERDARAIDLMQQNMLVQMAVMKALAGEDEYYYGAHVEVYDTYAVACTMEGDWRVPYTIAEHDVTIAPTSEWVQVSKTWVDVSGAPAYGEGEMARVLRSATAPRYTRALCDRTTAAKGQPGTPIRFVAGSEGIKRDGLDLKMSGARLDAYRKNPVVLWAHDYRGLPIGRAETTVEGTRLLADITFDQEDERAQQIESKYRRGYLNTVSLGWDTKRVSGRNVTEWELLDISAVPVPGDADALMERQVRALRAELLKVADDTKERELLSPEQFAELKAAFARRVDAGFTPDPPAPDWQETAQAMTALILFPTARPGRAWRAEYHTLARQYEQLGKEPPERLAPDYLATLDSEALRGLFLEGEPDLSPDLFTQRETDTHPLTPSMRADLTRLVESAQRLLAREEERATEDEHDPPAADSANGHEADPTLLRLATILGVRHADN